MISELALEKSKHRWEVLEEGGCSIIELYVNKFIVGENYDIFIRQ